MRVAAGILMIMSGLCSPAIFQSVAEMIARTVANPQQDFELFYETLTSQTWMLPLFFLSLGLTVGGGICVFRKKAYWWALAGGIWSVFLGFSMFLFGILGYIFLLIGILALIFVIKRKGEFE